MVNDARIEKLETELRNEIRLLRDELQTTRDELAKAQHWCARHWTECHERHVSEQEGQ